MSTAMEPRSKARTTQADSALAHVERMVSERDAAVAALDAFADMEGTMVVQEEARSLRRYLSENGDGSCFEFGTALKEARNLAKAAGAVTGAEPDYPPLPSSAELRAARKAIESAVDAVCGIRWRVWRIAKLAADDAASPDPLPAIQEAPTFEQIGRLYVWMTDVRNRLKELTDALDELDQPGERRVFPYVYDLDTVRDLVERGRVRVEARPAAEV